MAQLAEHSAVNRRVPGSSPGGSDNKYIFFMVQWSSGMILS